MSVIRDIAGPTWENVRASNEAAPADNRGADQAETIRWDKARREMGDDAAWREYAHESLGDEVPADLIDATIGWKR